MRFGKKKDDTHELSCTGNNDMQEKTPAVRKDNREMERSALQEAKERYLRIRAQSRAVVQESRESIKQSREVQRKIQKSFDKTCSQQEKAMEKALGKLSQDQDAEASIEAARSFRRLLGSDVQESESDFDAMLNGKKPFVL